MRSWTGQDNTTSGPGRVTVDASSIPVLRAAHKDNGGNKANEGEHRFRESQLR